jgi:hypothetical protein
MDLSEKCMHLISQKKENCLREISASLCRLDRTPNNHGCLAGGRPFVQACSLISPGEFFSDFGAAKFVHNLHLNCRHLKLIEQPQIRSPQLKENA